MKYKKGCSEYISNGHYEIDSIRYMSIWSFKKSHNIEPNYDNVNGPEGRELSSNGVRSFESKPDFGNYDMVLIYPISDLENYYGV